MAWFAELAGKAEHLLNNLDEQTGAALRGRNVSIQKKLDRYDIAPRTEPPWGSKKRPITRNSKKVPPTDSKSNYSPQRKHSPTSYNSTNVRESLEPRSPSPKPKRSPTRRPQFNLDNSPKTLVGDIGDNEVLDLLRYKAGRRHSLPMDLQCWTDESLVIKMQNLEVENAMLKNELNVTNKEVMEFIEKLRIQEEELNNTNAKLEKTSMQNESLSSQLAQLNFQLTNITTVELTKLKDDKQQMENELIMIRERNMDLENTIAQFNEKFNEKDSTQAKLENELRHAQSTIQDIQNDLEKSNGECRRMEKDWETYKLRVKSMLGSKDKEIKSLQEGTNLTEDTKELMEEIDTLKEEREVLSEAVTSVRGECDDMKAQMARLEARHSAAERVVLALRDALKDERAARNRAEAQCSALVKDLKSIQMETEQTIAGLESALRDKEHELLQLRDCTSSTLRTADTSALNVADYDVTQNNMDSEKVYYLTEKLVQSQGKNDKLLADNNMLRIHLDKLESKLKAETQGSRANAHSVVNFQDGDRFRNKPSSQPSSSLTKVSRRMDMVLRRHPILRILLIIYMIGLHFWVITVLFASTPEQYTTRPNTSK